MKKESAVQILSFPYLASLTNGQLQTMTQVNQPDGTIQLIVDNWELEDARHYVFFHNAPEPAEFAFRAAGCEIEEWGRANLAVEQIKAESNWVIERLKNGQRVLVHCIAEFNCSVTICRAELIMLEGISAELALTRIREYHPWARPDSHHWLQLCWLAN